MEEKFIKFYVLVLGGDTPEHGTPQGVLRNAPAVSRANLRCYFRTSYKIIQKTCSFNINEI